MQKSKLIGLLKTLSKEEIKKFQQFINSPYFNKNSNAVVLIRYLSKFAPLYNSEKLQKEIVYTGIFPGRSFNIKIIKNLMTELLRLAERYLEQSRYEKNKAGRNNYLLEELLSRKQYNVFAIKAKLAEEYTTNLKKDEVYFYNNINLYSLKHSFELRTSAGLERIHGEGKPIEYLSGFFLIWYFKYSYNMINRKIGYNFDIDLNFIEKVIEYVKERDFENKKIILLYYYMFMINLKWNDENYFYEFKKLTDECSDMLTQAEQFNLYTAIQAHCQRKLGGGEIKYRAYFFEACKNMVLKNACTANDDGVIHPLTYKNIAKAGAAEKQFNWTIDFIENYRKKLPQAFQNNVYHFSVAYNCFMKKDYEKSLENLSVIKYENVYDKAEVNRLMMQIYYEMGWTEELLSLTDTYKHFLHNDKLIAEDQKKAIGNFVNLLISLYKIKTGAHDSYNKERLKKELTSTRSYEKIWLMQKLEEIKNI